MWWMLIATNLLAIVYFYASFGLGRQWGEPGRLWILSVGTGTGYGIIFTMGPSILRNLYDPKQFGRNWGLLSNFSAIGALIYTTLYGILADRIAERQRGFPGEPGEDGGCRGRECFKGTMGIAGIGTVLAIGLVLIRWRDWRGRV